ncbi:TIGR02466 family protein [Sphingomonas sp. LY29]|uniref:TIGR02466 family protein n=1 Tax=Sphingomonas sp. LY29 TaxID=3095341 RepID=UPI002D78AD6E|nr:TIGR02466 family protein [Sphingomonas sp. LY29]WRP25822.1 TIGR02466 family protein [Sphingomonas sp. LY29]
MMMRELFATPLYEAEIADETLLNELAYSIRTLAADDVAGRRWSREKGYKGYTSYASLDDLPRRDPAFADLAKLLTRHAVRFAEGLALDLARKPRLDSLWVNLLKPGGHHSAHLHPNSFLSGTLYVEIPTGSGAIRFEDPRSSMLMASPPRLADAPEARRSFVTIDPRPGLLLMWESFLRHEVLAGPAKGDRLSISFNFA